MILYKVKYYEDEENLICICVDIQLRKTAKYVGIENMPCDEELDEDDLEKDVFYVQYGKSQSNDDEEDDEIQRLKNELLHVHGMEELLSIRRHRLIFIKGDIFKKESVVNDVLMVLLQNFDSKEGIAKEIEPPTIIDKKGKEKKESKKEVKLNSVNLYNKKMRQKIKK